MNTVQHVAACLGIPMLALLAPAAQAGVPSPLPFTQGDVVVVRVGDGAAALTNVATAVFLDEYTPGGALVQTIALPTGLTDALTNSGSATSEGFLTLSSDGQYLIQAGYRAIPGTPAVVSTPSLTNPRVIARIDLNGNIDTTTALGDAYSANNIRSATSDNGTEFWTAGTASSGGGVRFVANVGDTTSTQLSTTITNTRVVTIAGGQLYISSSTGAFQGVSTVGAGLPTTSGQTISLLPGFPTSSGPSAYDHFFADANTLYVADDRTTTSGGIQKWTQSAGTWTLQYTLNPAASTGCRGLTGINNGGVARLFATTTTGQLITVTDTGAGSAFSTVASAPTNTAFRGVRYLPVQSFSQTVAGSGCAAAGPIASVTGGAPTLGNLAMTISVSNATPSSLAVVLVQLNVPSGAAPTLHLFGAPGGSIGSLLCFHVFDVSSPLFTFTTGTDGAGNGGINAGLPATPSLLGFEGLFQWIIVDGGPLAGNTLSDAVLVHIGDV